MFTNNKIPIDDLCECGCGGAVTAGKRFIRGHHARVNHPMKGRQHTEEAKAKNRNSHLGKKHTSESIQKMIDNHPHNHVRHNLKTGENMGEMNMLALQFINGGYDG